MNIITFNVNGIRAITKKDFAEDIENLNPDVLCIQETKAQDSQVEQALKPLRAYRVYNNAAERKGYSGVSVLSKKEPVRVSYDMAVAEHDSEGRIICAEFESFYLVNVYVPNSGRGLVRLDYRAQWDADFLKYLKNLEKSKPVIACGDFNVAHQPIDLKNDKANYNKTAGYTQVEIDGMTNILNAGFIDVFRYFNPDKVAYTYWSYRFNSRAKNVGWRLDYFLVSESFVHKVKNIDILDNIYGSDHCPVRLTLKI